VISIWISFHPSAISRQQKARISYQLSAMAMFLLKADS